MGQRNQDRTLSIRQSNLLSSDFKFNKPLIYFNQFIIVKSILADSNPLWNRA